MTIPNEFTIVCHPSQEEHIQSIVDEFPERDVEVLVSNYIDPDIAFFWKGADFNQVPLKIYRLAPPPLDEIRL